MMSAVSFAGSNELPPLNTQHKDLIHDISFNFNGKMLATCSSDQTIKIWKNNGTTTNPSWTLLEEISRKDGHTHRSSITTVQWANPVFGCIFASCSTDKSVNIFARRDFKPNNNCASRTTKRKGFRFDRVYHAHELSAVSIAFAPSHLGLQLAVVCKEGKIRFLKAKVGKFESNLRQWHLSLLELTKALSPLQCVSYSPALLSSMSVGAFPNKDALTASSSNPNVSPNKSPNRNKLGNKSGNRLQPFCMAWNASKWELPAFVVGADRNRVFVYKYFNRMDVDGIDCNQSNAKTLSTTLERAQTVNALDARKKGIDWHCVSIITIPTKKDGVSFDVRGISWSNHLARKYHLIAIGCSDGFVRILKLMRNRRILRKDRIPEDPFKLGWSVVFESNIHCDAVWKVNWNITGNLLLSAGDDARIYLWKRNRMGGKEEYIPTCISHGKGTMDRHKASIDNEDEMDEAYYANLLPVESSV